MQADAGDYAGSWKLFEQALVLEPGSRVARSGQVRLAMEWLRHIRTTGQQTFTEIVAKLLPVLYRGAATATGVQAADLLAHIGWANYLKYQEGIRGMEIDGQFKQALKVDPDNLYAHAMWGHWILWQRGSLDEANSHFSAALKSGRDNGYVRLLKLSALLNTSERGYHPEILRLLNEMRQNHDTIELWLRGRIVNEIYYVHTGKEMDQLLASIPAKDNLETLRWLTQEIEIDQKVFLRIILARLTEATGDFHGALSLYQSLKSDPDFERFSLKEEVNKGIERISGTQR
jgi:tetratricopeptide (TPR) repeat protein